jgi:hypothetical protein
MNERLLVMSGVPQQLHQTQLQLVETPLQRRMRKIQRVDSAEESLLLALIQSNAVCLSLE